MIRIILHLVLINQVFGSIFDTYLYREGNRGCLGEVVLAYRFNSSSECSPSCQTLSSGQALPINGRFQCPLKWTEPFRLTGSKRFVKVCVDQQAQTLFFDVKLLNVFNWQNNHGS
jgi:hypothetical protein